jgi:hypothetical protein
MENSPFDKTPMTRELYDCLLEQVRNLGPIFEEAKKTSAHIVAGSGAFLGLHPRVNGLLVNIVLDHGLANERVVRCEQVSKSRFHNEVRISGPDDIDDELMGWVKEAYHLKANQRQTGTETGGR